MRKQKQFKGLVRDSEGFHGPKGRFVGHEGTLSDETIISLVNDNLKSSTVKERNLKKYILENLKRTISTLQLTIEELNEDGQTISDIHNTTKKI